jgi:leader peptidase (prepilin peptidase)/N-methyltransferase
LVFAAMWGGLWGSFFNVCIYRVPLYVSVVHPRSRCPRCGRGVKSWENIPVLSWLLLRGRCAGCALPISLRYPLVELFTACVALVLWYARVTHDGGDAVHLLARFFVEFALAGVLIVLSGIDIDHFLIPDRITYPAIPVFFVLALFLGEVSPFELVLGPFVGYGLVALFAEVGYLIAKREVMGYGDAKLLALLGAAFGWRAPVFAFFAAPFAGLLVNIPLQLLRRRPVFAMVEVPYGPFLALAGLVYPLVDGDLRQLVAWYLPS